MNTFVVAVTCAVAGACPLPKALMNEIQATNLTECQSTVKGIISHLGYKPSDFHIYCRRK